MQVSTRVAQSDGSPPNRERVLLEKITGLAGKSVGPQDQTT